MTTLTHTLSQVGFTVPDLGASVEHAQAILGLEVRERSADQVQLGLPGQPACLVLNAASELGITHMRLRTDTETYAEVTRRAEGYGTTIERAPGDDPQLMLVVAPNGMPIEIEVSDLPIEPNLTPRELGPTITRLDHLSFTSENLDRQVGFFEQVLGFTVTDSVADKRRWLRCGPNHHTIAIFEGPNGLHHYAFQTVDFAELQRLGDLLAFRGENFMWGPGRHNLGANIFTYVRDPAGSILEICCDMIQVESDSEWVAQVWPADGVASAVMWGQLPPPDFRTIHAPLRSVAGAGR